MRKTLLEKARNITNRRRFTTITSEDVELVVAHLLGIVTINKIQKVKGIPKGNSIYSYMFRALREGVKRGELYVADRAAGSPTITSLK